MLNMYIYIYITRDLTLYEVTFLDNRDRCMSCLYAYILYIYACPYMYECMSVCVCTCVFYAYTQNDKTDLRVSTFDHYA